MNFKLWLIQTQSRLEGTQFTTTTEFDELWRDLMLMSGWAGQVTVAIFMALLLLVIKTLKIWHGSNRFLLLKIAWNLLLLLL